MPKPEGERIEGLLFSGQDGDGGGEELEGEINVSTSDLVRPLRELGDLIPHLMAETAPHQGERKRRWWRSREGKGFFRIHQGQLATRPRR